MELRRPDNGVSKDQMAVQLPPNCLQESEFQFTVWSAVVPTGMTAKDLIEPGFWGLYAPKLKPFDEVRARAEDGTWMARFVVLETGRTWARLQMLELHPLGTQDMSLTKVAQINTDEERKKYTVRHRGPRGWSVLLGKEIKHEGAQSKDAAEKWLTEHLKTTAPTGTPAPVAA